jgi:hypothetical protein
MWSQSVQRRFWSRVRIALEDECWMWTSQLNESGYGVLAVVCNGRKFPERAHRISWSLRFGPIPEGICVCHKCDVRACVNPYHLFLGSRADNLRDMRQKGRGSEPPRMCGEKHPMSRLSQGQVDEIRARYASGSISQAKLGKEYRVSQVHVGRIVRGEVWQ